MTVKSDVRLMCMAAVVEAKEAGKFTVCEPKRRYNRGHNRVKAPKVRAAR